MPFNNIPPPKEHTHKNYKNSSQLDRGGSGHRYDKFDRRPNDKKTWVKYDQDSRLAQDGDAPNNHPSDPALDECKKKKTIVKDRFHYEEDDYFSQINEEDTINHETSELKHSEKNDSANQAGDEEDEDDPLDAYMKTIEGGDNDEQEAIENEPSISAQPSNDNDVSITYSSHKPSQPVSTNKISSQDRGIRLDIDEFDDIDDIYLNHLQKTKNQSEDDSQDDESVRQHQDHDVEYDDDDNIIGVRRIKNDIEPLPAIDHSSIHYDDFERNFYQEHSEIANLTQEQGEQLRAKLEIKVCGQNVPKPVCSFGHFRTNFDEKLMDVIAHSEYSQPTPIQAQAIPAALSGRNIIGIAQTGSGKTAAYLWPMIMHIMPQPDLKQGDGPIGLVLVPTRELALQVYEQAKKFSKCYNVAVVCAYGGGPKYEQKEALKAGAEIVVATPGRLIDLIKSKATNLKRVTYLVLDEADRLIDMGFEVQVKSICKQVRPDRQTLLFSATFRHKTEQLARSFMDDPIRIVQKSLGEVNDDVTQHVIIFKEAPKKWDWLLNQLVQFTSVGSVLIFVGQRVNSAELHKNLEDEGKDTLLLNGDIEQSERNRVLSSFKKKEKNILIATDVAARGLDISHIRTVINYDVARDIDTHIHRIGRTGRAGIKGDAYTLITDKDKDFAGHLVTNLENSNQKVSDELINIAMQSHSFRKTRKEKHGSKDHAQQQKQNKNSNHHNNYNRDQTNRIHGHKYDHHSRNYNQSRYYQSDAGSSSHKNPQQNRSQPNQNFDTDRKKARWN